MGETRQKSSRMAAAGVLEAHDSISAIDDKAELQEFDQTAPKPTLTIRDFRAKQLGCLIVPICY